MGYYFREDNDTDIIKKTKQKKKELEDIQNSRREIRRQINNMTTVDDYMSIRENIRQFSCLGGMKDLVEVEVQELNEMLLDTLKEIKTEAEELKAKLFSDMEKLELEHYRENATTLDILHKQSEIQMYEFHMQLRKRRNKCDIHVNKRLVGNWVKNADRVNAIALARLSTIDEYKELFTAKQLDTLVNKAKSSQQVAFEIKQKERLEKNRNEATKMTLEIMKLKRAIEQMQRVCGDSYFNKISKGR